MSDWIQQRAKEIKDRDARQHQEMLWQMQQREILKTKTPTFWKAVVIKTLEGAKKFNESFSAEKHRQIETVQEIPNGFLLRRSFYPSIHIKAECSNESAVIQYELTGTRREGDDPFDYSGIAHFTLAPDESVNAIGVGEGRTPDDVAKFFLGYFFEGL